MNCFTYSNGVLRAPREQLIHEQVGTSLYSQSNERTVFVHSQLQLTNERLICRVSESKGAGQWQPLVVDLDLAKIVNIELKQPQATSQPQQPLSASRARLQQAAVALTRLIIRADTGECVQVEFEYGGHNEFHQQLNEQLNLSRLIKSSSSASSSYGLSSANTAASGIVGIQRKIQHKLDQQDQKINDSFKDLSILMTQAKEMVSLSNSLIAKLVKASAAATATAASAEAGNSDTDEMNKLKSYFANMGLVDNPVTKETSGSSYHTDLAREISKTLTPTIVASGGIMTLADVFCRLNRARGIAGLVSPDDLLNACKQMNKSGVGSGLRYNVYADLNLHVLELEADAHALVNKEKIVRVCELVDESECLTAYALSKALSVSLIVAKKFLLDAEKLGRLCRDDTSSGLKFYTNRFPLCDGGFLTHL